MRRIPFRYHTTRQAEKIWDSSTLVERWFLWTLFHRSILFGKIVFFIGTFLVIVGILLSIQPKWSPSQRVIFILDTSLSMRVEDIETSDGIARSRLTLVRETIREILERARREDTAISFWLISYRENPILWSPITQDFIGLIPIIDLLSSEGGSSLDALRSLLSRLYDDEALSLYIFTDGGWELDPSLSLPIRAKMTLVTVATPEWWPIPLWKDILWKSLWKEKDWQTIISKKETKQITSLSALYKARAISLTSISEKEKFIDDFFEKHSFSEDSPRSNHLYFLLTGLILVFCSYFFPRYVFNFRR